MGKPKHFTVPYDEIRAVLSDLSSPDESELDDILAEGSSTDGRLKLSQVNSLVNAVGSARFPEIRERVIQVASDVRRCIFNGHVVVMAPIEVGNVCCSDCNFCGWRVNNHEMPRSRAPKEVVLEQARYLISKGIYSIELVCGDDPVMVRDMFPELIGEVRKLFPPDVDGRIQICTMSLTKKQYEELKEAGADGIIVWQESYNKKVYRQHIHSGPKGHGMTDDWKVDTGGDGFTFRLQSQDRALEAGLEIALGSMLGLNPNLNYEILATIQHARHLFERGIDETNPLIVGMPTWNKITTPKTDMRPPEYQDPTAIFPYVAAVYLLSLDKKKAWIFPNCRVPLDTQVQSLLAGGVYTSTEVKLGPGGYLPRALQDAVGRGDKETQERIRKIMSAYIGRDFHDLAGLQAHLDQMEQFQHYFYTHKEYKRAFHNAGLHVSPETSITPDDTLQRLEDLHRFNFYKELASISRANRRKRRGLKRSSVYSSSQYRGPVKIAADRGESENGLEEEPLMASLALNDEPNNNGTDVEIPPETYDGTDANLESNPGTDLDTDLNTGTDK